MTNAEKYLKDNVSVEEFIEAFCMSGKSAVNGIQVYLLKDFFNEQVAPITPKLTEDEKIILRNIRDFEIIEDNVQTIIIGNNKEFGGLYIEFIYNFDDGKGTTGFSSHKEEFRLFNHLFQFIQERRRI